MLKILEKIDSTNTFVKQHFFELADGDCVAALEQTAGRGRLTRKWYSPPGKSVALSVALRRVEQGYHAGVIVSLAALVVLREMLPEADIYFKWPNDLYCGKMKLAGILSEGVLHNGKLAGVVCGIGININQSAEELSGRGFSACSAATLSGRNFDVKKVLEALEKSIKTSYIKYNLDQHAVLSNWKSENRLIGKFVELIPASGKSFRGVFSDIAPDGAMLVEVDGLIRRFDCGDVKIELDRAGDRSN